MIKDSSIAEIVCYSSLFFSFLAFSGLPFSAIALTAIYYIHITFFLIFLIIKWDFNSIISFRLKKISTDNAILFLISLTMLLGVFYFNFKGNSDLKSFFKVVSYFPVFFMFAVYIPGIFNDNPKKFEVFLNIVTVFSILNGIYGWFTLFAGLQQNPFYPGYLMGFFNHPNASGFSFSIVIPIVVYKMFMKKGNRFVMMALLVFFLVSLLFTFSRAAYIAAGISLLLLSYFKSRRLFLVMLVISFILIVTIFADFAASKGGLSSLSRLLLFVTAYDMIVADPFHFMWGYGVVNFYDTFTAEKMFLGSLEVVADPHNFILLLGIQFGMILTTLTVIYVVVTLVKSALSIKKYPVDSHHRHLFIFCYSSVISILIQNLFEDIVIYPEYFLMPLFFIYYGFLVKTYKSYGYLSNINN